MFCIAHLIEHLIMIILPGMLSWLMEMISRWPFLNLTVAIARTLISSIGLFLEVVEFKKGRKTDSEDVLLEHQLRPEEGQTTSASFSFEVFKTTKALLQPLVKVLAAIAALGFHIVKCAEIF